MMRNTRKYRDRIAVGYDGDCGGYGFDRPPRALPRLSLWDDGGCILGDWTGHHGWDVSIAFDPHNSNTDWPDKIPGYERIDEGVLLDSEHDCHCYGKQTPDGWEFTGNAMDDPWPDCDRCDGDGYVESPGGSWAAYKIRD